MNNKNVQTSKPFYWTIDFSNQKYRIGLPQPNISIAFFKYNLTTNRKYHSYLVNLIKI